MVVRSLEDLRRAASELGEVLAARQSEMKEGLPCAWSAAQLDALTARVTEIEAQCIILEGRRR